MLKLLELTTIEEFFTPISGRRERGVYFYRFSDYHKDFAPFFLRFLSEARQNGVFISGKIENPDKRQLDYYEEMMGQGFSMERAALEAALSKWLPRLEKSQREALAEPLFEELALLQKSGKTENMLKNAYIKFMCWLYYRFEQLVHKTGGAVPPKLLYEGAVGDYQLRMLSVLAKTGCDILLILPDGEAEYRKADPDLSRSKRKELPNAAPFPAGFSVLNLQPPAPPKATRPQASAAAQNQAGSAQRMTIPPRPGSAPPSPSAASAKPSGAAPRMTIPPRPGSAPPSAPVQPKAAAASQAPRGVPLFRPEPPQTAVNMNTWITGNLNDDAMKPQEKRGNKAKTYYTMFVRMRGAEDKSAYRSELVRLKLKLEGEGRGVFVLEKNIPTPTVDEVNQIRRDGSADKQRLLPLLAQQLQFRSNREVESHAQRAFLDILSQSEDSVQRLTNRAVYVLSWLRRYLPKLFPGGKADPPPTLIYYGACQNEAEAALLRVLARLPADIWIICPDLSVEDHLTDPLLFERNYRESMPLGDFPKDLDDVRFGTVAYRAEQELNTLLYENSGMYRNHQFKKAMPVTIQTTYEEIAILWNQEAKYRPNFEVLTDRVMLPVICAKISGVRGGNVDAYWSEIEKRKGEDVFFSDRTSIFPRSGPNPMVKHAPAFIKNGKLQVRTVKAHPAYPYAFLREDMQDYMMDKLQTLIESKLIAGTFQNGAEYTIVSTAMNLDKQLIRMLQKFDFTKQIPKLLLLNTSESLYSIEDAVAIAYLNLLGFDIALYVPTGYQVAERYYTKPLFVEQQAGDYLYDLHVPDWGQVASGSRKSLTDILFRRGN